MPQINKEDEFQKIFHRVLRFLSFRARSKKEILDYLNKKKVGEKRKKQVLEKLKKINLLDDKEFVLWWVEQRINFRPSGRRLLEQELRKKGVEREIIEETLEEIFKKEGKSREAIASRVYSSFEVELALRAAKKKFNRYKKLSPLEFRQKMAAFLSRRGFSWEVIKEVVDEILKKG